MVNLVSDSSTLYSTQLGKEKGITIIPLRVTINNKTYHELDEISTNEFVDIIRQGHLPMSSQPPIGAKEEVYRNLDGEILDITMADGLSGTYHSASMAKEMIENNDHITVINTKTLCGPHRYIVNKALELANQGANSAQIVEAIRPCIDNGSSFLIPNDFSYLKRGGRLNPVAATLGGLMKIVPILEISEDGKSINKYGIKKTIKKAVESIITAMQQRGVDQSYYVSISHGNNPQWKDIAVEMIEQMLHNKADIFELTPAFITQGGPGCIAIQYCKK